MQDNLSQPPPQLQENSPIQQLLATFEQLYGIKDPIHQEYELIQAAQKSDLPIENFRQLFKSYCQQQDECQAMKCWWKMPFFRLEQGLERLNQSLSRWDLFQALEYASKLSVLIGILVFLAESPQRAERQKAEQKKANYEAWNIVNSNKGNSAGGGRIDALQDLNESKVSLAGLNVELANLPGIRLSHADLRKAELTSTNLSNADLSNANLVGANLAFANLEGANLEGANLRGVHLNAAKLKGAKLNGTDLRMAKGLSSTDIKMAQNWQNAFYDPEFRQELGLSSSSE